MQTGVVFDIKKFSIHDGPGIRTTVFFKGCPLHCWWCHNPESQSFDQERLFHENRCIRCRACVEACGQGAITWQDGGPVTDSSLCTLCGSCVEDCHAEAREIVGRQMTVDEVLAEIGRDTLFYDESGGGVTFSGGEPLSQPRFLQALLVACRARELHTVVDTCGHAPWQSLKRVIHLVDLWLYDLKVMDSSRHETLTGVSNDRILNNLQCLSDRGSEIIVRVPVIPGANDDRDSIEAIGRFVVTLPSVHRLDLLPYHRAASEKYARLERDYALQDTRPPSEARMEELARCLRPFGKPVKIGGLPHGND